MPIFNVLDFGAAGDGSANDAPAIQRTIDACTAAGGGTVLFPSGRTYFSGSFRLGSNVSLFLDSGSVLQASGRLEDYPPQLWVEAVTGGKVREDELPPLAFIIAYQAEHVSIGGGGVIDGNGRSFVAEDLGYIYRMRGERQYLQRPFTIFLIGCKDLRLQEFTVRDAAFWTIRLGGCENIHIEAIRILNDLKLPNNDGLDLDCCRNVHVTDCHIIAGDDAICLKTCRALVEAGYGSCENITVDGCTLMTTSAALKIGNECRAPIRNIVFNGCIVRSSNRGLSIHLSEAGEVEDVRYSNMIVETRLFHEAWWGRGEPIYVSAIPWDEKRGLGHIRQVRFSHILAHSENGVVIRASEADRLDDIELDDVHVQMEKWTRWPGGRQDIRPCAGEGILPHPEAGFFILNAGRIAMNDCHVVWGKNRPETYRYALESHGVRRLENKNFHGEPAWPRKFPAVLIE